MNWTQKNINLKIWAKGLVKFIIHRKKLWGYPFSLKLFEGRRFASILLKESGFVSKFYGKIFSNRVTPKQFRLNAMSILRPIKCFNGNTKQLIYCLIFFETNPKVFSLSAYRKLKFFALFTMLITKVSN